MEMRANNTFHPSLGVQQTGAATTTTSPTTTTNYNHHHHYPNNGSNNQVTASGMMDPQQQFCLKWNSFGTNLASAFSNLFKSETLADVTLFCEGVTFRAHKLILAACSKHLADLFETAPLHQNLLVILDGTSASNMAALLEFMYKGEVHVSQSCLSSFLKAAECLQVKGLSIEHEARLAAAHQVVEGMEIGKKEQNRDVPQHTASSPSTTYSQSPVMSPYMHSYHQRMYDRHPSTAVSPYESRKRHLPPSPPDAASATAALHESVRASVLRDGSKAARNSSPQPMPTGYGQRDEGERYQEPDASVGSATTTFERADEGGEVRDDQQNSAEDLRVKMEPSDRAKMDQMAQEQDQPLSSTTVTTGASNGSAQQNTHGPTYKTDPDKSGPDIISANMWNSVSGKLGKTGAVTSADGKKLKCPFCERLYGYETNLRAHIRQRHQGIRVPCPFCSRTFTRNNTVRRHIAREHKAELSLKAFQETQQLQNQSHHSTHNMHQNHAQ